MTDMTVIAIAQSIRGGSCSAVEVVSTALDRIAQQDSLLRAFVSLDPESSRDAARRIDEIIARGDDPGPLAGVPVGIKDNEACAGFPTRHGSLIHSDAGRETRDSEHVRRLRSAGAVFVGKVATAEFGLDGVTHTLAHGTTRNPWRLSRTPGGSSGGSAAAVAAGLVPLCTGSDALGSIRVPAGFTGLVGMKPSHGRIPRAHGFRDTASLGALTSTVLDTARYLDVVSGPHNGDRMSLPRAGVSYENLTESLDIQGLRVAWSSDLGFAPVEPQVLTICQHAYRRIVDAARLRIIDDEFTFTNVYCEWNALAAIELIGELERAAILPDHLELISPGPRSFIESAQRLTLCELSVYRERIRRLEAEVATFFETADLLITPASCCTAYPAEGPMPTVIAGRDASRTHAEPFTAIGSICWNPSISVPAGLTREGMPVGLLVTGPRHRDDVVLRLARIWEQESPWPRTAPPNGTGGATWQG